VGAFGILLAGALLLIPAGFLQEYTIDKAGTFLLSGIILGVGLFGGYAAIVAVFLGIAGLTPRRADAVAGPATDAADDTPDTAQRADSTPAELGGDR